MLHKHETYGFSVVEMLLILAVLVIVGLVGWRFVGSKSQSTGTETNSSSETLDVSYGSDPLQKLDIYQPDDDVIHPALVLVHGGGWVGGDKEKNPEVAEQLAQSGFVVFNINYRLATPELLGFPMEVNDVKLAVDWAIDNSSKYRADNKTVSLMGGSAGAHLSAMAAAELNKEDDGIITKVILMSGPMDLPAYGDPNIQSTRDFSTHRGSQLFLGCSIDTCSQEQLRAASPAFNIFPSCPKSLIINSELDNIVPLSQAQSMHSKLQQNGCDSTLKVLEGKGHAFGLFDESKDDIVKFLNS